MTEARALIDISQALRPGLPVWPGDTHFEIERVSEITSTCPVTVSRLTLSTHSGAHADAPCHYAANGADTASVSLVPYLGLAQLFDVSGCGPRRIRFEDLGGDLAPGVRRVLLKTYVQFPHHQWVSDFATPDPSLIVELAQRGVVLIGVDAPSLDPESSKDLPAHHAVKAHGMAILEGLVLDAAPPGLYELIALPLKIVGADAAPVRAVLRPLTEQK